MELHNVIQIATLLLLPYASPQELLILGLHFWDSQGLPVALESSETNGGGGRRERRPKKEGAGKGGGRGGDRKSNSNSNGADSDQLSEYDGRMVWVNSESSPQTVSRSITGAAMPSARNGFPVYVFAKYDKNSNVAVKGVVSAQRVLAEKYEWTLFSRLDKLDVNYFLSPCHLTRMI